jgi:hypothetical protein
MHDLVRARATAGRVLSKARQHLQGWWRCRTGVLLRRGSRRGEIEPETAKLISPSTIGLCRFRTIEALNPKMKVLDQKLLRF